MLPQNGHQLRPHQQPGLPSFMSSNSNFDSAPYFNLDPSQAAKQMAALTAASQARIANSRVPPAPLSSGGTNSGPFLGGINSNSYPPGSHDLVSTSSVGGGANYQMPNNHGPPPPQNASFLDPSMPQSNPATRNPIQSATSLKQRQQGFLNGLASIMAKRSTPLPPALTGVPASNYDPNNSPWKIIEPSPTEIGSFRLAGKDVDLFKLWGVVFQNGGGNVLTANHGWNAILSQFDLPEEYPPSQSNGSSSVALVLSQYYMAILYPFEEMYKRNMQEQHKRAQMASRQAGTQGQQPPTAAPSAQGRLPQGTPIGGQPSNLPGQMQRGGIGSVSSMGQAGAHAPMLNTNGTSQYLQHTPTPQTPHQRPSSAMNRQQSGRASSAGIAQPETISSTQQPGGHASDSNVLDQDVQGIKRKLDVEEGDSKRARQKTGSEPPESTSLTTTAVDRSSVGPSSGIPNPSQAPATMPVPPPRPRQQPSRRKIEYVPLAREVETSGGRDLKLLESESTNLSQRRPLRDIGDWGTVDIEALTMSIRSRLSTELSYALTTFTLLSTMRGQTPGSGFPIFQCVDLLDEVLDLLDEQAFGDVEDSWESSDDNPHLFTNRELVNVVYEAESQPFASLEGRQGSKDPNLGPRQRPGNIVLTIINIIRNLSTITDNHDFISRHGRLVDLTLRLCTVVRSEAGPRPASSVLSLGDLITIRKDTLYTLSNIAGLVHLSSNTLSSRAAHRMANRAFQLITSYLVDPTEAVSPLACIQLAGVPLNGNLKPPLLADMALEVFTRLSQSDVNRQTIAKAVPHTSLCHLFESLVHRLPVLDADFQLVTRELWLSYLEKNIMAIYSLAFLAPPELKEKVKNDRSLGFKAVMLRMIQKFLMNPTQEGRTWFMVCARRAIEAMKVLDDAEDSFDTSKSTVPTLSFGMGYGEVGDNGAEKGTGLLGGNRDVAWDIMMMREVQADDVMFNELESLARVESY